MQPFFLHLQTLFDNFVLREPREVVRLQRTSGEQARTATSPHASTDEHTLSGSYQAKFLSHGNEPLGWVIVVPLRAIAVILWMTVTVKGRAEPAACDLHEALHDGNYGSPRQW